jgi:hypothetical protein
MKGNIDRAAVAFDDRLKKAGLDDRLNKAWLLDSVSDAQYGHSVALYGRSVVRARKGENAGAIIHTEAPDIPVAPE